MSKLTPESSNNIGWPPFRAYRSSRYVCSKAGKAYSVVDRCAIDTQVQIEILALCDVIRGLLKTVNQGLKIRGQKLSLVVSHDRTYHVPERRQLPERRNVHKNNFMYSPYAGGAPGP
jgi:hypothetical protein